VRLHKRDVPWVVALLSGDPEDEDDPPIVVAYRPPCGLREFDLQEGAAATDT
jgi:hypothetical protein